MTLASASWLITDKNDTNILIKKLQKFGNDYPNVGYGGNFSLWLKDNNPKPYNSWGNGSAMRVSPVSWISDTLSECENLAKNSAIVTHNHPEGIKGAQAIASAVFLAKIGKSKSKIKNYIENKYDYDLDRCLDEIRPKYSFDVSCQGSVPESIISFLEADNFEDCIRNAVSLGGDADTQAAIARSIGSAYFDVPDSIYYKTLDLLDDNLLYYYNQFVNSLK